MIDKKKLTKQLQKVNRRLNQFGSLLKELDEIDHKMRFSTKEKRTIQIIGQPTKQNVIIPAASAARAPPTCSICGMPGHNRQNHARTMAEMNRARGAGAGSKKRKKDDDDDVEITEQISLHERLAKGAETAIDLTGDDDEPERKKPRTGAGSGAGAGAGAGSGPIIKPEPEPDCEFLWSEHPQARALRSNIYNNIPASWPNEDLQQGLINCPEGHALPPIGGGCNMVVCRKHEPWLYFCAVCKKVLGATHSYCPDCQRRPFT